MFSLLLSSAASAGASPNPSMGEAPRYETVVHGEAPRRRLPADDPAAFATVVELEHAAVGDTLLSLLAEVPGLRLIDGGSGGQAIAMRGAQSHQVAIFLDDVRLTAPGRGRVDLSLFDPHGLGSIEVRRSGGSARFGNAALGGTLLLRSPRLRRQSRSRISVGYGSFHRLVARGMVAGALGRWRVLASGSFRRQRGDYPFVDDVGRQLRRENNDAQLGELVLKADYFGPRWRITLLENAAAGERGAPGPGYDPSLTARQQDLRNISALSARTLDLIVPGDVLKLSLGQRYGYFRFRRADPGRPPASARDHSFGIDGRAELQLPLWARAALFTVLQFKQSWLFDRDVGDRQRLEAGVQLSAQLPLWHRRLEFVPALRSMSAHDFGSVLVPKLGLVLRPLLRLGATAAWYRDLELVANVGRAYRYPTFEEQYIRLDGFGGNPDLEPEDAITLDVGARILRDGWAMEVAYFSRRMKNTILFAPVSSFLVRPDNYSDAHSEGVEAALELHPGWGLALRVGYTFAHSRWGENRLRLPGQPRHVVASRIGWDGSRARVWRLFRRLSLWAQLRWQGAMPLDRFNNLPQEEGRLLASVGGAFRLDRFTISLEGQNLLDKRDAVDAIGFPLAPARVFVSASASFGGKR